MGSEPTATAVLANGGTAISEAIIDEFEGALRGELIRAGDAAYDEARKVFNAMIDKHPALIVRCAGGADVVAAVNFARTHGVNLAVRGAGHNVAGTSVNDGGIVIDLSGMRGIRVDPEARTVRVEGGATWADVTHELQVFGLAATGGFVGTTGVSGLTLGGGLGWLVRKHGLALDNLLSVDIVTADGQFRTASATQNEDLFWAVRGGGGNFGVVTSFEFRVHPAGTVLAGMVLHPVSRGRQALEFWREFEASAPEEWTAGALLFNAPAEMPVPDDLRKEPIVGLGGVYTGSQSKGEGALRPLREFGPPEADTIQPVPYTAAQSMADIFWPRGYYNYWKSNYLKELSSEAIDTILGHLSKVPSSRTVIVIEHIGDGAMSRVGSDQTAFGHRNWAYNFLVTSTWKNPAESEVNIRWTQEFFEAMRPFLADAAYVNYLGDEGEERTRSAYSEATYQRLVSLKNKYDPDNLFQLNQNIRPSA